MMQRLFRPSAISAKRLAEEIDVGKDESRG
jgi:hypothetical protein